MSRLLVEFINTCPCCDEYVKILQGVKGKLGDVIELKIYYAGKNFDYVRKYGQVSKGTMIIDGRKKFDSLTAASIEKAIADALAETAA